MLQQLFARLRYFGMLVKWRLTSARVGRVPTEEVVKSSHIHPQSAHSDLADWRRRYGVDYRGRPLERQRCRCGQELELWPVPPDNETGVWAPSGDEQSYVWVPPQHDVYTINRKLLRKGTCMGPRIEI